MISLGDFVNVCMAKKGFNSYADLLREMNKGEGHIEFQRTHLSELINGVTRHDSYIKRMEEVFELEPNTLMALTKKGGSKE